MIFGENNAQIINSAALFLEHCNFPSILTLPTIPRESQCKCWEVFFRKHIWCIQTALYRKLPKSAFLKEYKLPVSRVYVWGFECNIISFHPTIPRRMHITSILVSAHYDLQGSGKVPKAVQSAKMWCLGV